MVAAFVARQAPALETRETAFEQRHVALAEFIGEPVEALARPGKALAELALPGAEHVDREKPAFGEGGEALRLAADRPEHDRRIERD